MDTFTELYRIETYVTGHNQVAWTLRIWERWIPMGTSAANHMCRRPLLNLDNFLLPTMQDSVRVCLAASQADTGAAHRQVTPGPRSQLPKDERA